MKLTALIIGILSFMTIHTRGQNGDMTPAVIYLKSGETINVQHFGQKDCNGESFFSSYIMVRGKYAGDLTEIKKYNKINKLELIGFDQEPVSSVGNQKGTIVVHKSNGMMVELEDAELVMSCFDSGAMYNQIEVQVLNPISEKIFEKPVNTKDIKSIIFM